MFQFTATCYRPLLLLALCILTASGAQKLLVVSVDGLDNRYLQNRDQLGLRIPNIRRLMSAGQVAQGVIGAVPTITWPSHTTLITGVRPSVHGIRSNRRPPSEGGDYPWSASLLKVRTLLDAARAAKLKTAAVTWPVTVDAPVDFNLPEYFRRRRGGAMDLKSIGSKSTPPDLVERVRGMFPSFAQEWMDDRTRTQAVVYLLKTERPDLLLVHLVDLDSEEHDNGPFSGESKAVLEYTDELLGQMMAALPTGYGLALVSDHGFDRVESTVNIAALAAREKVSGVQIAGGIALAGTPAAAEFLAASSKDSRYGIGQPVSKEEVLRFIPDIGTVLAAWQPAPGFIFGSPQGSAEIITKAHEVGQHGLWPTRYRSVFVLRANGIAAASIPEIPMEEIAGKLASVLGVSFRPGEPSKSALTPR